MNYVALLMAFILILVAPALSGDSGTTAPELTAGESVGISIENGTAELCQAIPPSLCEPVKDLMAALERSAEACSTIATHKPHLDTLYEYLQYKLFFDDVFERSYGPWDGKELNLCAAAYNSGRGLSVEGNPVFNDALFIGTYSDVRSSISQFTETVQHVMASHDAVRSVHIMDPCYTLWSVYPPGTLRRKTMARNFEENFVDLMAVPSFARTCVKQFRPNQAVCVTDLGEGCLQLHYPVFVGDELLYDFEVIFRYVER